MQGDVAVSSAVLSAGPQNGRFSSSLQRRVHAFKHAIEEYYQNLQRRVAERALRVKTLKEDIEFAPEPLTEDEISEKWRTFYAHESHLLRMQRTRLHPWDFDVLAKIGQGAYASVYVARKKDNGHVVALKRIEKALQSQATAGRIKTERAILSMASSPWLMHLFYAFQDDTYIYLGMSFAQGGDLSRILDRAGALTLDTTRFYLAEMVVALEALHTLGFMHRDLKPQNFLLDSHGHLVLADFGLSRSTSSDQTMNPLAFSVVGTPDYIAPEILDAVGYWERSDFWSLGCCFYEMVSGVPPFDGENVEEVLRKIKQAGSDAGSRAPLDWLNRSMFDGDGWDLLLKLLCPAAERLADFPSLKAHPFFAPIQWVALAERNVKPPFRVGPFVDDVDVHHFGGRVCRLPPPKGMLDWQPVEPHPEPPPISDEVHGTWLDQLPDDVDLEGTLMPGHVDKSMIDALKAHRQEEFSDFGIGDVVRSTPANMVFRSTAGGAAVQTSVRGSSRRKKTIR